MYTLHIGIYGFCCVPCASADARRSYDGSNFWFNLLCVSMCAVRNVVRLGNNIKVIQESIDWFCMQTMFDVS